MLHWLVWTCRRVAERATDLDEGVLSPFERLRVRMHLSICRTCTRYLKQLELTKHACGSLKQDSQVSPDSKAKALEAFRSNKKA